MKLQGLRKILFFPPLGLWGSFTTPCRSDEASHGFPNVVIVPGIFIDLTSCGQIEPTLGSEGGRCFAGGLHFQLHSGRKKRNPALFFSFVATDPRIIGYNALQQEYIRGVKASKPTSMMPTSQGVTELQAGYLGEKVKRKSATVQPRDIENITSEPAHAIRKETVRGGNHDSYYMGPDST